MLAKALLAVRRARGRIYPRYADPEREEDRELAETLIRLYQEHLGRERGELEEAIALLETHKNFKLVRGLSELLARRCIFALPELAARPIDLSPQELREQLFQQGYVTTPEAREAVFKQVAQRLGIPQGELERLFWADREEAQVLKSFDPPSPTELLKQYNFELTQTLLFDCTELEFTVRGRGNFQEIFRWIKRLGLMYEVEVKVGVEEAPGHDELVKIKVTGPASILGGSRYGTAFAKLLPVITKAEGWSLRAKIRLKVQGGAGAERPNVYEFRIDSSKGELLGVDLETEKLPEQEREQERERERFDSQVEKDFAGRIKRIMPDWEVKREPTVLVAGRHVLIPDFGFVRRHGRSVKRLYLEIVGFWTEEYLKRKIAKLREIAPEVPLMIAVNKDLNCSPEDFGAPTREVIFYDKTLPLEPVIARLQQLAEEQAREELEELKGKEISLPDKEIVPLQELAGEHGVGVEVIRQLVEAKLASDNTRKLIGDKIVTVRLLRELQERIEALPYLEDGESRDYFQVKALLEEMDLPEQALKELGYKVEWRQLLPPDARVIKIQDQSQNQN